uniref:Dephospho-CoA kinase n=1 Tax=Cyanothece sp. (strain PCC 7425 / ATCC 29141) TaxID=395961 RepID=B8HTM8_CYAP4
MEMAAAGQRIIGLTGGIATGKSTVANYLKTTYGVPLLDADLYARQVVEPGSLVWQAIVQRYGRQIALADGQLDRVRLGEIIFSQPAERLWLEAQIHPQVRDRLQQDSQALSAEPALVMVIPLLFEARMTDLVTEIWVVTCPATQQLERLIARNALTPLQAQARINSQMPLEQKVAAADIVLNNSSTPAALFQQVDRAWQRGSA